MFWARIDNRLVHGQVIETWIPFTNAKRLVVANDELAQDVVQQDIMSLAIPHGVAPHFVSVAKAGKLLEELGLTVGKSDVLVLFATCEDARRAFENGLDLEFLNVGNLHYGPGKKQICAHVAISSTDENCLLFFDEQGVELDFRCIPSENIQVKLPWR